MTQSINGKEYGIRAYQNNADHERTSERFSHIQSDAIEQFMLSQGFSLGSVVSRRPKLQDREGFQKHTAVWTNPDMKLTNDKGEELQVRFLIQNSHLGNMAAKVMFGIFRVICTNGLIVGSELFSRSVRHVNDAQNVFFSQVVDMISNRDKIIGEIQMMQNKPITKDKLFEMTRLVKETYEPVKTEENKDTKLIIDVENLLKARRNADNVEDTWTVFNRVQENAVKNNNVALLQSTDKIRLARKIGNKSQRSIDFNKQLWSIAAA